MKKFLLGLALALAPLGALAQSVPLSAVVVASCEVANIFGPVGRGAPLTVTVDGVLCTTAGGGGGGGTSSTFGAAFPATGTAAGFIDPSGDMAGAEVDADGSLNVNIASGSLAVTTTADATAAAPTYSEGVSEPFSQNLTGDLRTIAKQSGTWTVTGAGGTFPVTQSTSPWVVSNGGTFAVQATQAGTWNITNISGTISLPTGAATAANQQTDALTDAELRATPVPISGTVTVTDGAGALNVIVDSGSITANAGTNLNTSALALETGGNLATLAGTVAAGEVQVNCTTGCSGGTFNNNADDVATSATNGQSAAWLYLFDGTTFDRWRGDSTNGALVNLGANNDVTVTGTVTANAGTNLNTSALLTSANFAAAFGTAGSADTQVMSVQGIASMTPLLVGDGSGAFNVIVDSGTLTAVTTITNPVTVTDGAGALNVIVDSGTVAATQSGSWSLAANQSVNVAQINGVTPLMGAGNTGTGSPRVTIATDQAALAGMGVAATAGAVPANASYLGAGGDGGLAAGTAALRGLITCTDSVAIDGAASGNTELVALTASETIYVCGYSVIAAGTVEFQLIYGTGTACATGETNLTGNYNLTAQAGIVDGAPFYRGMKAAVSNALCYELSGAVAVDGVVYYTKF